MMLTLKKFFLWMTLLWGLGSCGEPQLHDPLLEVRRQVKSRYMDVMQISTDTLADWMKLQPGILLLDVREQEEFDVSHLKGARSLPPNSDLTEFMDSVPRSVTIVAYCSVGYRSSEMARRLSEKGYVSVFNLDGSIFQWANEGKALVSRDGNSRVHPYNQKWGRLLDLRRHQPGS